MNRIISNPHLHIAILAISAVSLAAALFYPFERTWENAGTVYHVHADWQALTKQ